MFVLSRFSPPSLNRIHRIPEFSMNHLRELIFGLPERKEILRELEGLVSDAIGYKRKVLDESSLMIFIDNKSNLSKPMAAYLIGGE